MAVVAALSLVGLALGNGDEKSAAATDSSPASASPTATSEPTVPSETPDPSTDPLPQEEPGTEGSDSGEVPVLPVVALDESVAVGDVTASIALIEEIDGRATGPGDVAGPALRVTVRVVNETSGDVALDGVSVNLYHGPERTPGSPLDDPSRSPFAGALPPGDAAEGVYVFRVPADAREDVTVEVRYRAGAPLALFSGPVG
ncbi:hypothetical protein [Blastococcus saxobsidens]|uniref:DUF4352 domain-containing protein n=1 Tax=Blastococcus saxobsidens (strain DD2) TaxID=1146883 RepID=H6RSH1_BLASD|nr:hypothetical protein [Blastococcus saxobsidens]CCG01722.1 conserved exported protein of unknown function [Blastococcus saxobsidens DD2]